ncbi:hypothetical protein HDU98_012216 [Podochytrium sp. JEL0797]|nr:hypothetical protein HDU98_012215 [Podochytrium sp. JEL0797]KAJ3064370.1 hypothetical protein HDU98_012216 [Podochytrium sp. JEL0797]
MSAGNSAPAAASIPPTPSPAAVVPTKKRGRPKKNPDNEAAADSANWTSSLISKLFHLRYEEFASFFTDAKSKNDNTTGWHKIVLALNLDTAQTLTDRQVKNGHNRFIKAYRDHCGAMTTETGNKAAPAKPEWFETVHGLLSLKSGLGAQSFGSSTVRDGLGSDSIRALSTHTADLFGILNGSAPGSRIASENLIELSDGEEEEMDFLDSVNRDGRQRFGSPEVNDFFAPLSTPLGYVFPALTPSKATRAVVTPASDFASVHASRPGPPPPLSTPNHPKKKSKKEFQEAVDNMGADAFGLPSVSAASDSAHDKNKLEARPNKPDLRTKKIELPVAMNNVAINLGNGLEGMASSLNQVAVAMSSGSGSKDNMQQVVGSIDGLSKLFVEGQEKQSGMHAALLGQLKEGQEKQNSVSTALLEKVKEGQDKQNDINTALLGLLGKMSQQMANNGN